MVWPAASTFPIPEISTTTIRAAAGPVPPSPPPPQDRSDSTASPLANRGPGFNAERAPLGTVAPAQGTGTGALNTTSYDTDWPPGSCPCVPKVKIPVTLVILPSAPASMTPPVNVPVAVLPEIVPFPLAVKANVPSGILVIAPVIVMPYVTSMPLLGRILTVAVLMLVTRRNGS